MTDITYYISNFSTVPVVSKIEETELVQKAATGKTSEMQQLLLP